MTLCYLGLGSNLCSPKRQLYRALQAIKKLPRSHLHTRSKIYRSRPYGVQAQPNFYNMVVAINTNLSPKQLLAQCQLIEKKHRRLRKTHWGPRTLDIDILLYDHLILTSPLLTIPHPDMLRRDFVLIPLLEIAPTIKIPHGKPILYYLKDCETHVHPLD